MDWKACIVKLEFERIRAAYGYVYDSKDEKEVIEMFRRDFLESVRWKEVGLLKFYKEGVGMAEIVPVDLKELVSRWIDDLAYIAYVRPRNDGLEHIVLAWEYMKYAPETYLAQKIGADC